ncbi:TPA: hypothetical protein SLG96_003987 [Citrobacter koseri]|uniref:hypothetical protein n=1 Tax=Citrobacter koseri TaxID=545 RepID=UPI00129388C5|nr:hypothetical protein [Citrobacter koseri]MBJ8941340.1 hypothetical protein [Citrobacter koseri]HEI8860445.1 hypothetical protein [Citrobacter koseri]
MVKHKNAPSLLAGRFVEKHDAEPTGSASLCRPGKHSAPGDLPDGGYALSGLQVVLD